MPLYEYKCANCGDVFELIQRFSDEPLRIHEKCGGPVERLISTSALQFKGSGWYVNDYARSGSDPKKDGPSKSGDENKTPAGNTKAEPKSEVKAESKSDAKAEPSTKPSTKSD